MITGCFNCRLVKKPQHGRRIRYRALNGCAALLVLVVGGELGCSSRRPKLVIPASELNLGRISLDGKEDVIKLYNEGDGTLFLSQVRTSCSCTAVDWPSSISAKDVGELVVKSPKNKFGPVSASITITSNDPLGDRVLKLKWLGPTPIQFQPTILDVVEMPGGRVERRAAIVPFGDVPLPEKVEVKAITHNLPATLTVRQLTSTNANELLFCLEGHAPSSPCSLTGRVCVTILRWNVEESVCLLVRFRSVGSIEHVGDLTFPLHNSESDALLKRTVVVKASSKAKPLQIASHPAFMSVELRQLSDDPNGQCIYMLAVEMRGPGLVGGDYRVALLSHSLHETYEIPIKVFSVEDRS